MSFFKYFRERTDSDGERLHWPGGPSGYPFRGQNAPMLKKEEYENLPISVKFRCKMFYLASKEDFAEYMKVRDKCANGLWIMIDKDRQWDEDTNNYRIFMEWVEPAHELPPGGVPNGTPFNSKFPPADGETISLSEVSEFASKLAGRKTGFSNAW